MWGQPPSAVQSSKARRAFAGSGRVAASRYFLILQFGNRATMIRNQIAKLQNYPINK
jgi:hypothetical protein